MFLLSLLKLKLAGHKLHIAILHVLLGVIMFIVSYFHLLS